MTAAFLIYFIFNLGVIKSTIILLILLCVAHSLNDVLKQDLDFKPFCPGILDLRGLINKKVEVKQ